MDRERITLTVEVDLDPVPGSFHTSESARMAIQGILDGSLGHYCPTVAPV